ncbi:DUF3857 domain-containing transglutaminase family protein [Pseudoxanthomonas sp. UTMC 1351]|uniref:DUF3857 domain-containing transglutaminase family protein n=1 Tax=Pseudoxanthomonas sp. UTMC 1351 TaxID=2695853 RepID=UPI0034CDB515
MNPRQWACGVAMGAVLGCGAASAGEAGDRPLQIEHENTTYLVNGDGSYVESREIAIKVLKESALESAKDASITYSTSIQKADVVAAYTLKANGKKIEVPAGNFQVNTRSGQDGESPIYSDQTTLTVVFPELAVGDTTVFSYRLTASKPMFDGHFSIIRSYSPATYYGDLRVIVDAPESLVAQHQAWQMKEVAKRPANGRKVVEWTWRNREPVDPESLRDSTYNVERYPGYAYSTFSSYAQIAQAYGGPANAKAVPDERIRTLADEIAGDATEPREIAKRLYEWVSAQISYAGNCIGLGAVVPRDLSVVLDNRMGDCKDHATLLQALLTAKGIDSTQALINAGETYTLPKVPVASMVNHVITYIPSLDLYADSTAATVPFGSLPPNAAGKPVLLVAGHRDDAKTPALQAGQDWQHMKTVLRIQPDGSVKGTLQLKLNGRLAVAARNQFRNMDRADADKLVKRYFQQSGLKAQGTLVYEDPKPLLEHFTLDASFDVEQMIPVPGGMEVEPWFISLAPVSGIVGRNLSSDEQAAGESSCGGILSDEEYLFEFPETMRIAALPSNLSLEQSGVAYTATYRQEANRIHVKRTLNDRTPGPVCSAEYNASYSQLMRKIMPDLRSQIIYLEKEAP